jgi:hypothetical protein
LMDERYDLGESKRSVRELYPVLLDAHGNVIDGYHRLRADPGWRTETLEHIKTPVQLVLARIIANTHRRSIGREEREEEINELARCLSEDEGVPREALVPTIVELTTFTDRYIRGLLSSDYKRSYTLPDNSELSSELDEEESGASVTLEGDYVEDVDMSEPAFEISPAEEYVAEYFSRYMQPDEDFLAWDVVRRFSVPESEARELIADFKGRRKAQPAPRRAEVEHERPLTCACPLCGRSGADKNLILLKTEDPELAQLTLSDFVMEALRG